MQFHLFYIFIPEAAHVMFQLADSGTLPRPPFSEVGVLGYPSFIKAGIRASPMTHRRLSEHPDRW